MCCGLGMMIGSWLSRSGLHDCAMECEQVRAVGQLKRVRFFCIRDIHSSILTGVIGIWR